MDESFPLDPWELTADEIDERIADKPEPLRRLLETMWRSGPRARLNAHALTDMPSFASLYAAVATLDEDELRFALLLFLDAYYQATRAPEEYTRWYRAGLGGD